MKKNFYAPLLLAVITLSFFYPLLKGHIPFPGDNLVGNYNPYSSYSHLGYAPGGVPNKAQGPDVIKEAFPWKFFVIESFRNGQIPFWTPYNFSGNPLMANFQSAVFYPLNTLFLILPFLSAWSVLIFLGPFLAALFLYLFLRELKLSKVSSIFGGIIFGFSSYMVVWLQYGNITHTFLWLPLALLFTEKLINRFNKRDLILLILVLWFSFLGGYIQGYFYVLITLFVYFFCKEGRNKSLPIKKTLIFFMALIVPVLLSLFQLLPTLDLFKASSRGNYTVEQIQNLLNPLWYLVTVIVPDFFGNPGVRNYWHNGTYIEQVSYFGVIPFILAIAALFFWKKSREIKIFGSLFFITLLISTDLFITKYFYTLPIPVISTTIPTRILGLFQFCGAILAAFGLDFFLQNKNKKAFIISSTAVLSIIFVAFCFTIIVPKMMPHVEWAAHLAVSRRNILLPLFFALVLTFFVFLRLGKSVFRKYFKNSLGVTAIIVVAFTAFDLFYFFHKITPFSPKEFVYPQTSVVEYLQKHAGNNRFWGYGSGYIQSNFQAYDGTYAPEGDDPLHIRWYTEFLETSKDGKLPEILPRLDANVANGYGPKDLGNNAYRQKVLNLLGIKYILHKDDTLGKEYRPDYTTFNQKKYRLVWQDAPWQIYENLSASPRAFLTSDYLVVKEKEKVFETFHKKNFDETKTIILEEEPDLEVRSRPSNQTEGKKQVEVVAYTPNKVVITTNSDKEALLFLSDTYYPEWKATIDGKATKVYKADYAFRAIVTPKGQHTVTFYYGAQGFKNGLLLSGVFAIALIIFLAKFNFKKHEIF